VTTLFPASEVVPATSSPLTRPTVAGKSRVPDLEFLNRPSCGLPG
jgi:hypothetical protein